MLSQHLPQQLLQRVEEFLLRDALQFVVHVGKDIRHCGVEDDVGVRHREGGTRHAELELVSGEGEGRGAVPVRGVPHEVRKHCRAGLHLPLANAVEELSLFHRVQDPGKVLAQEDGDDGRRRLVGAEAVVVSCRRDGNAQEIRVLVHRCDHRDQEGQETQVLARMPAGIHQVDAGVGLDRPVVVLSGTVDSLEGLFMKQAGKTVAVRHLLHHLHGQLVVVRCHVRSLIDRRQFVLCRRDLVVLGLRRNSQLPELHIQVVHEGGDLRLQDSEIMVLHLLALRRVCPEECSAAEQKILSLKEKLLVDQEVLLLGADGRGDPGHILLAYQLQKLHRLCAQRLHGAEQRRLLIQCLSAVRQESCGNVQRTVLDERGRGRIPRGVPAGLKGGAQTAGGEAGRVRLALHQLLSGKLHQDPAVLLRGDEAVMLLRGQTGHRLEPVREVGGTVLDSPFLHGRRDRIRHIELQVRSVLDGLANCTVDILREAVLHDLVVKNQTSVDFGDRNRFFHNAASFSCRKAL